MPTPRTWTAVVHGDGLTSLQFRRTKGGITAQTELAVKGADVIQLERKGGTYIFSAAKYGEPFTTAQVADVNLGDDVLVGLALCSHNAGRDGTGDLPRRADHPAREGRRSCPTATSSAACSKSSIVQTGHRQIVHRSEQPFEAPNWTTDGAALIYNRSGRAEGWGGALSLRPRDAAVHAHRHGRRQPQQQRSRALVRRHHARHQRSEPGVGRPLDDLHGAGRRRHAEADHDAVAVVSPQLVARRQGPDLHRRTEQRVRHLPHPGRRQRAGGQPHQLQGAGRRPRVHAGRQVHLLQLGPQRDDADLADEAGRHGSRADHERRVQQLVPAHLAGRPVDRHHQLLRRRSLRPITRTTSTCTCG